MADAKEFEVKVTVDPTAEMDKSLIEFIKKKGKIFENQFAAFPIKPTPKISANPDKWNKKKLEKQAPYAFRMESQIFATRIHAALKKEMADCKKSKSDPEVAKPSDLKAIKPHIAKLKKYVPEHIKTWAEEIKADKPDDKRVLGRVSGLIKNADPDALAKLIDQTGKQFEDAVKALGAQIGKAGGDMDDRAMQDAVKPIAASLSKAADGYQDTMRKAVGGLKDFNKYADKQQSNKDISDDAKKAFEDYGKKIKEQAKKVDTSVTGDCDDMKSAIEGLGKIKASEFARKSKDIAALAPAKNGKTDKEISALDKIITDLEKDQKKLVQEAKKK